MKIYIANDHGGTALKEAVIARFSSEEYTFVDLGTDGTSIVRYPYYAEKVALAVEGDPGARGILICSTGIGMSIAANKFKGIRAALCTDPYMAKMTRRHNDSNILCLGGQVVGVLESLDIVETWLGAEFEGGRHEISLSLLEEIEDALVLPPPRDGTVMTPGR